MPCLVVRGAGAHIAQPADVLPQSRLAGIRWLWRVQAAKRYYHMEGCSAYAANASGIAHTSACTAKRLAGHFATRSSAPTVMWNSSSSVPRSTRHLCRGTSTACLFSRRFAAQVNKKKLIASGRECCAIKIVGLKKGSSVIDFFILFLNLAGVLTS